MSRKIASGFTVLSLALLFLLLIYSLTHISRKVTTTFYKIEAGLENPIRIVQLTDLHQKEFGRDNCELISLVKEQSPDLIFMTGDMQNKNDVDFSVVCTLIQELSDITDVYYSYGNHEVSWIKKYGLGIESKLTEAGAFILDNSYRDININGNEVRIAGYEGYYRAVNMTESDSDRQKAQLIFMDKFEDTNRYKILLNHIPTSWVDWGYVDKYSVDLIFSGHYHGGQMKLPFVGALYVPYIGFFPENTQGIYQGDQATCILSTGLGSEYFVPRINNPPEIVVVDICPPN